MTIQHPDAVPDDDQLFVFAEFPDITISICAPLSMTQEQIEAYAMRERPPSVRGKEWIALDKGTLGMGQSTPNPCNWEPKARQHWFLICE